MMTRWILLSVVLVLAGACVTPSNPQGTQVPSIFGGLGPQQYTWHPERAPNGPVLVFVSIPRQEAVVYRNGVRIGRAAVSTGKDGHQTPVGVFQILQKEVNHRSATYNNAPMPYMERLTWDGVALHAGFNPGHPASHGCVRLPPAFAKNLYSVTHTGGTVIISNSRKIPTMTLTSSSSGLAGGTNGGGATSVVMSVANQRMVILQNGRKAAESPVVITERIAGFRGESVFILSGDNQWHCLEGGAAFTALNRSMQVPTAFKSTMRSVLHPGTTFVVTSEPLMAENGNSTAVLGSM